MAMEKFANVSVVFKEIDENGNETSVPFEIFRPTKTYVSASTRWIDFKNSIIDHGKRCYVVKIIAGEKTQWQDTPFSCFFQGKQIGDECINYLKTTGNPIYVFIKFYTV